MSRSNYKIVFSIQVMHTYFSNGICKGLGFIPCTATALIMKRYGFILRDIPGGFGLYANTPGTIKDLLNAITKATGGDVFVFNIEAPASLYSCTDMPFAGLQPMIFSSRNTTDDGGTAVIAPEEGTGSGTGFGKTLIYFDDVITGLNNAAVANYTIKLKALSTQWQYYIINRNEIVMNSPAIAGKAAIKFTGPDDVTLACGEKALLFTSGSTKLELKEKPEYSFNLVAAPTNRYGDTGQTEKIIYKGLPNPVPGIIGQLAGGQSGALSSPMYVYL